MYPGTKCGQDTLDRKNRMVKVIHVKVHSKLGEWLSIDRKGLSRMKALKVD
jgi:hypothetical protein